LVVGKVKNRGLKKMKKLVLVFILFLILLPNVSCNSVLPTANSIPNVVTKEVTEIADTHATLLGTIIDDGGGCTEVGSEYYKKGEQTNSL